MTKVAFFSDLHLEFGPFAKPPIAADVVVLAGDTFTKGRAFDHDNAQEFFGCPVIAICGNHEFYGGQIDTGVEKLRRIAAGKGITLLEQDDIVINGTRFLGCTLWSDFRLFAGDDLNRVRSDANLCTGDRYSGGINDFRSIRVAAHSYRRFRPKDAAMIFTRSVAWLDERLGERFDGPTVVVTHHAPSALCVPAALLKDHRTAAYASHLDWLIEKHRPEIWCSGHIHENREPFSIGETLMVSNPRGYWPNHLNPKFRADFVLDVTATSRPTNSL